MSIVHEAEEIEDRELVPVSAKGLAVVTGAEIDAQIATARRFPRDVSRFRRNAEGMVCFDKDTAAACIYSVPRGGKPITGPSVRMSEIIAATFGNCRVAARVIDIEDKFVVAQAAFHDLETNSAVTFEVRRRITDKNGNRFNDDMIGVTAAAACAIARRNAVFAGVPKALWKGVYDKAANLACGEGKSLAERQDAAAVFWKAKGVKPAQIAAFCGKRELTDLTGDDLVSLIGVWNAIKDGDTTAEAAFAQKPGGIGVSAINERLNAPAPANADEIVARLQACKSADDVATVVAESKSVDLTENESFRVDEAITNANERINAKKKK